MNPITILVGCFALGYGIFTAIGRMRFPEKFSKLEPMKRFWGPRAGIVVHVVGYTVLPIIFGIVLIIAGMRGANLF